MAVPTLYHTLDTCLTPCPKCLTVPDSQGPPSQHDLSVKEVHAGRGPSDLPRCLVQEESGPESHPGCQAPRSAIGQCALAQPRSCQREETAFAALHFIARPGVHRWVSLLYSMCSKGVWTVVDIS